MAYSASNQIFAAPGLSLLSRFGSFFIAYTEAPEAMPDAERTERGLSRDTIMRHVFADLIFVGSLGRRAPPGRGVARAAASDLSGRAGAGGGNRTRVISLEG